MFAGGQFTCITRTPERRCQRRRSIGWVTFREKRSEKKTFSIVFQPIKKQHINKTTFYRFFFKRLKHSIIFRLVITPTSKQISKIVLQEECTTVRKQLKKKSKRVLIAISKSTKN